MINELSNHLWQSTAFALAAGFLTRAFRRNRAHVRYWLWFTASLKFFMPFALLMSLGSQVRWTPAAQKVAMMPMAPAIVYISQPFPEPRTSGVSASSPERTMPDWRPLVVIPLWMSGLVAIVWMRLHMWRRLRAVVRASRSWEMPAGEIPATVTLRSSPGLMEPGVVGLWRPILLVPADIDRHLTRAQLAAVLEHELCHVRRRDNLTAAIHMVVEAIFWFHPLVWWIGARLLDERERACDEEVVRRFGEPLAYARGLLNVCKRYVETPLVCVSGVGGANLTERIEAIISNRVALKLGLVKRALLTVTAVAAVIVPVAVGVLNAPSLRAQSTVLASPDGLRPAFEVASIRPVDRALMERDHQGHQLTPTRFVDRTELMQYIAIAYVGDHGGCNMKTALGEDCSLIVGSLPAWVKTQRFEILATLPANVRLTLPVNALPSARIHNVPEVNLMLQVLLEDRFRLKVHRETRELPVWALTIGKNGPKLKPAAPQKLRKAPDGSPFEVHGLGMVLAVPTQDGRPRRQMTFQASSMQRTAEAFAMYFDRAVVDLTGLKGEYDFTIDVEIDADAPHPAAVENTSGRGGGYFNPFSGLTPGAASSALQDVGLRLESAKAPVEVIVIDHVEKPSPN